MFERLTDTARRVVVLSQDEARNLNHNYIGTEHLLLGLLAVEDEVACEVLTSFNFHLEETRDEVVKIIGQGKQSPSGHIPFTPRAKKIFELSLRESLQLGHNYIGTEHILLGLIREGKGVAAQILEYVDNELPPIRQEVIRLLDRNQASEITNPPLEWKPNPLAALSHHLETAEFAFEQIRNIVTEMQDKGRHTQ